jgi:Ca2+/H+ antiporter
VIPSSPYNGSTELQATWHSTCVTAPLGAPNRQNAYVFTFIFDTDHSDALEDDIGFTISVGNDTRNNDGIKVLRLSNFPVSFSDVPNWGEWDDTTDATNPNTGSRLNPGSVPLEVQLEAELQRLQVLRYELQQLHQSVALQEKKIFHMLKQDCKPLLAKWQQCEDFFCYLKSSWQKVPEFYWSIRYRLGLLGPGRIIPICRLVPEKPSDHDTDTNKPSALPSHPVPTPSKHAVPTHPGILTTSSSTSIIAIPSITTAPLRPATTPPSSSKTDSHLDTNPNYSDITEVMLPLPMPSPTKKFFRSCAIILLIALIIGLFFRVVRHSTAFRRRRRDIASRREELRAQRAYRNAARRLRWRQWWEGRFYFQAASVTSSHSLPEFHHVRGATNSGDENNRLTSRDISNNDSASEISSRSSDTNDEEPRQRMMQAEILGLRRVLEYVGQLVGTDGTNTTSTSSSSARRRTRSRSRSVPPPYEQVMRHNRNHSVSGNHHHHHSSNNHNTLEIRRSATPGVISAASGGPSSPRASTMFSLETGSLVTLETLDTLDSGTAPPSYHP